MTVRRGAPNYDTCAVSIKTLATASLQGDSGTRNSWQAACCPHWGRSTFYFFPACWTSVTLFSPLTLSAQHH